MKLITSSQAGREEKKEEATICLRNERRARCFGERTRRERGGALILAADEMDKHSLDKAAELTQEARGNPNGPVSVKNWVSVTPDVLGRARCGGKWSDQDPSSLLVAGKMLQPPGKAAWQFLGKFTELSRIGVHTKYVQMFDPEE